ncbi:hypothetical protein GMOD_00004105 [Pyrenophora seminiperda CCB06]|uniref:Uncharacterized protein n=1 Tax=Pyrenophora seminiperda CCB06 TaxID=1302712 RepID=A0A3M7M0G2_9PLEO|nr:hypothetical protein GMOD_00004105 [Pyrenophora seminiperda CCB06]
MVGWEWGDTRITGTVCTMVHGFGGLQLPYCEVCIMRVSRQA